MAEETLHQAVDRLDAAFARLEAATLRLAERQPASAPTSGVDPAEHAALIARHAALRDTLSTCLGEIDAMIAETPQ